MEDRPMMFHGKYMHPAVLRNWSLVQLGGAIRYGRLHFAIPNPEHPDNKELDHPF
jgi:hypothetical protein